MKHTMKNVVIIGAGGFGREVLDLFEAYNLENPHYEILGYIVQKEYAIAGEIVNEKPILGDFDWLEKYSDKVYVTCAVGAPHDRRRLIQRAMEVNCRFCNIIHPSAYLSRWINMGEGVIITAGCILTTQIRIGNHVHINPDCTIGHDAIIEDFVSLAPGVHISGNVTLSTGCYIGTGVNIIEKVKVGEWSIVGAGSTIISDIRPNTTVVGVPGRVVKEREIGWHMK